MTEKIAYNTVHEVCDALGIFANARLAKDKDLILMVTKIDGRETLATTRISEMTWYQRLIRWFGFGPRTVYSVAHFLNRFEPYLPNHFSKLRTDNPFMSYHYLPEDAEALASLSKDRYKQLKEAKSLGLDTFKRCVVHHNQRHCCSKVYIHPHEGEKIDLTAPASPMGVFPLAGRDAAHKIGTKYKAPRLDLQYFEYTDRAHRQIDTLWNENTLGFCYEYGLGIQKDIHKAYRCYEAAHQNNSSDLAAQFNLARLSLIFKKEPSRAKALFHELQLKVEAKVKAANSNLTRARQRLQEAEMGCNWEEPDKRHLLNCVKTVVQAKEQKLHTFIKIRNKTLSALARC